jgi:hypothetical protein
MTPLRASPDTASPRSRPCWISGVASDEATEMRSMWLPRSALLACGAPWNGADFFAFLV